MSHRIAISACVLLSACAATFTSPSPTSPASSSTTTPSLPTQLSAKTAVVILRAKGGDEVKGTRILSVSTNAAPNGIADTWTVSVGSINTNELFSFDVATTGIVGKMRSEPYNPVFDDRAPPFLEDAWSLDSTDAARTLPDPSATRSFFLESDDDGVISWVILTDEGMRTVIKAGESSLETPPPSVVKRARR